MNDEEKRVVKDTAKNIRKNATNKIASDSAAAATGGTSKAVESAVKIKKKINNSIDKGIAKTLGVSKNKVKMTRVIGKFALPLIIALTFLFLFLSVFDFIQISQEANDVKAMIDEFEKEFGKDLLRFTDDEFKGVISKMRRRIEEEGYKSMSYIDKLVSSYDSDSEKTAIDKALEAMERYLRAEKSNFNKIKWVMIDAETGEKKTPMMYETLDGLQLPRTNENYFGSGVFPTLSEDSTIDKFRGYLQTWSIPFTLHIATSNPYFADDVLNKMYSEISAEVYCLSRYTQTTNVNLVYATEPYTETVTTESGTTTVTKYRVKQPLEVISSSSSTGSLQKTADSVATFINYAETYKGIYYSPVKVEKKSDSTYQKSEGTPFFTGEATASGISATRTDTETWRDLATQEQEFVEPYEALEGVKPEALTVNRVQAFLSNPVYGYDGFKYDLGSLAEAFRVIDTIHVDALTEIKSGEIVREIYAGASLAWPVPDCTIAGYWFKDPLYKDHTGIDISNEGKITNEHGPVVIAAADGTIKKIVNKYKGKEGKGYGNYVEIDHGNGVSTRYAHLFSVEDTLKEGAKISEGTKLGYMGTTGNSSGIHLHFEVLNDGVCVDPFQYYLYEEKNMNYDNHMKIVKIYTGRKKLDTGNVTGGMYTAEWQQMMDNMIQEAIAMAHEHKMVYNQGNRPIKIDTRPTSGDCSSFVANLYYRYFNHAYIGSGTADQIDMSNLQGIKGMYVEGAINSDGTFNFDLIRPGDVMIIRSNGDHHAMMFLGEVGGLGPDTYVDHGGPGLGPNLKNFYKRSVSYRTRCKVIRYYTDQTFVKVSGASIGNIKLGSRIPSADYNAAMRYFDLAKKWGNRFGIDPYIIIGVIVVESSGQLNCVTGSALGLMQVMEANLTQVAYYADGTKETLHYTRNDMLTDADKAIQMGCANLRECINICQDNLLAGLQGYNFGPYGLKSNYIKKYLISKNGKATDSDVNTYLASNDTGWMDYMKKVRNSKELYCERVLSYYDTKGGTQYPYLISSKDKSKVTYGSPDVPSVPAGKFPKYRQFGAPWGSISFTRDNMQGSNYTIANTGCGPTSLAIVLSGLGVTIPGYDGITHNGYTSKRDGLMDPSETAKFVVDCGGKDRGPNSDSGSNMTAFCTAVAKACPNLEVVFINTSDAQRAYNMIANQGYVAVANSNTKGIVSRTHFTAGGHYIAVVGARDGKFDVIDPGSSRRDGTSCSGCKYNCGNVAYTPTMMNAFTGVKGGGIRRWCLMKVKK